MTDGETTILERHACFNFFLNIYFKLNEHKYNYNHRVGNKFNK